MPSYIFVAVLALGLTWAINAYRTFAKHLAAAKASNLPYVIVPVHLYARPWIVSHKLILPYLRKLPASWTRSWLDFVDIEWVWAQQYTKFKELGHDTFLTVSPTSILFWTADANAISQITTRRNDFPKPIHMYGSIDIFGKNVISTEGPVWRRHRKITNPPFTEKNNHLVWRESLHQAQAMLRGWTGPDGTGNKTVTSIPDDAMRLSLYIISRSGFGVRLQWPEVETDGDTEDGELKGAGAGDIDAMGISNGHTMTYTDALQTLLHNILFVMLMPRYLLKHLPFQRTKLAYQSFIEWGKYMDDMFQAKKREVASGDVKGEMDLMGALVKGAGIAQEALSASSSLEEGRASSQKVLTDQEILGNAFVFILAGHETAANSIHFSLLFLAMRTSSQRHLQEDLTEIFGDRPIPEWDYERDLPRLFGGMAGAVLAEELRLVPPVTNIPKTTPRDQIQPLVLDNKTYNVPAGTMVNLCTSAVHRNPKFWPVAPPSDPKDPHHPTSNLDNNLEEFLPERWLLADDKPRPGAHKPANSSARTMPSDAGTKSADTDDLGVNTAADTAATLLKPPRGAYIPFSEGYRACLGRRFAQVEILAVLAVIFNHYSVELAVDDWATDEEVEKMDMQARRVVWEKARQRARWLMREGMGVIITMQMRKGVVPLRIVRRGEERFRF